MKKHQVKWLFLVLRLRKIKPFFEYALTAQCSISSICALGFEVIAEIRRCVHWFRFDLTNSPVRRALKGT
ncbi:hypothetical protein, partial [Alcanivorax sediminis]|uniref:hypothetical protein n=1 Tax=Alcanivorax sediminis TaxID=2663008 RepID=UPI003C6F3FE7